MTWKGVLKNAETSLDAEGVLSVKPEETDRNCIRKLKNIIKKVRRFRVDGYTIEKRKGIATTLIDKQLDEENWIRFYVDAIIADVITEETACEILDVINKEKLAYRSATKNPAIMWDDDSPTGINYIEYTSLGDDLFAIYYSYSVEGTADKREAYQKLLPLIDKEKQEFFGHITKMILEGAK